MLVLITVALVFFGVLHMFANARANISNFQEDIHNSTQASIRNAQRKTRKEQKELVLSDKAAAKRFKKRADHLTNLHNSYLYGGSDQTPVSKQKQLKEQTNALKEKFKKKSKPQFR